MLLQVGSVGRVDMHDGADLGIHGFLDEASMEVAGVEGDESNVFGRSAHTKFQIPNSNDQKNFKQQPQK